jgi:hypothetical protein
VPPPPTAYTPRQNPSFTADGAPPAPSIIHTGLLWHGTQTEAATRFETRKRRLDDLEMGLVSGRPQTIRRRSVVCVFCLASRDVCLQLGINVVPVLFNTFGEGKFNSSLESIHGAYGC